MNSKTTNLAQNGLTTETSGATSQLQDTPEVRMPKALPKLQLDQHEAIKGVLEHHVRAAGSAPEALRKAARALASRGLEWHSVACRFTADRLERAGVSDLEDGALPALLESYARVHDCIDERRVAASLREIAGALPNGKVH